MPRGHKGPVVLVVEDVDWIRDGMAGHLRACGYAVVEARDAAEAMSLAEVVTPAVILTEEELPTYEELTRRLREHPALRRLPVVIINPDAEEGARHGDSILLADYALIEHFLAGLKR